MDCQRGRPDLNPELGATASSKRNISFYGTWPADRAQLYRNPFPVLLPYLEQQAMADYVREYLTGFSELAIAGKYDGNFPTDGTGSIDAFTAPFMRCPADPAMPSDGRRQGQSSKCSIPQRHIRRFDELRA